MPQVANFISTSTAVNGYSNAFNAIIINALTYDLPMFDTLVNVQKRQFGYSFLPSTYTEKIQHETASVTYNRYMKPLHNDTNNTTSREGCCAPNNFKSNNH